MSSPWQQYINTEIQKHIGVETFPATGNATAGKYPRFTGVGLQTEQADSMDFANVFTVAKSGGQFNTIQAALDAAPDFEITPTIIIVYPGVYTENLIIGDKNLNIIGYSSDRQFFVPTQIQCGGGDLFTFIGSVSILTLKNLELKCGFLVDENFIELDPGSDFSMFYQSNSDELPVYYHATNLTVIDCSIQINNAPGTLFQDTGSPYKMQLIRNQTNDIPLSNTTWVEWNNIWFTINESHNYGETDWAYIKTFDADMSFTDCRIRWGDEEGAYLNGNKITFLRDYNNNNSWSYVRKIPFIRCEVVFSNHHSDIYYTTKKLYHNIGSTCGISFDECVFKMSNTTYGRVLHTSHKAYICYLDSTDVSYGNVGFFHCTVKMEGVTGVSQKQLIILKKPPVAPTWSYINSHNDFSLATFVESGDDGIMINDGVPEDVATSKLQFGDAGHVGGLNTFARANHTHGMPRNPIVYVSQAPTNPREGDLWIQSQ